MSLLDNNRVTCVIINSTIHSLTVEMIYQMKQISALSELDSCWWKICWWGLIVYILSSLNVIYEIILRTFCVLSFERKFYWYLSEKSNLWCLVNDMFIKATVSNKICVWEKSCHLFLRKIIDLFFCKHIFFIEKIMMMNLTCMLKEIRRKWS